MLEAAGPCHCMMRPSVRTLAPAACVCVVENAPHAVTIHLGHTLVAGVAAGACGLPALHAIDQVRIGNPSVQSFSFLPLRLGTAHGFFSRYGIDPEEVTLNGSAKMHQAMAAGSLDIALGAGPDLIFPVKGDPEIAATLQKVLPEHSWSEAQALLIEHEDALAIPGGQVAEHRDFPGVPDEYPECVAPGDIVAHDGVRVRRVADVEPGLMVAYRDIIGEQRPGGNEA